MRITVRLFAILRERAGVDEIAIDVPENVTAKSAGAIVADKYPATRDLLPRVAYAVNRSYVRPDTRLKSGDELALIPPVSGG